MVSIKGLSKASVLAALYNNARTQGRGVLQYTPEDMAEAEATELLQRGTRFEYLRGRVLKVDLTSDEGFEEWLYDRDNGVGAAQRAVDSIRKVKGGE